MAKVKKLEVHENQGHLFPQMRRDYNPFWMSSLFSDVYLKNDVPRVYKHLWENDEIENSESGFAKFYQGFVSLAVHHENSKFESWNEAQTVHDWIVPIMDLLGWENNSVKGTSSYLDNETFNIENQTYKPDLIYFDEPKFKDFTQKQKKDVTLKLNEVRNSHTGAKIVVEAKHWNRLTSNKSEGKKDTKLTDSAVSLGPELQTLKYMEVLGLDFGILTDGKIWKLFHKDLSKSVDKRSFTFDLGKLKEIAQDLYSYGQEELFRENAKYFYYFFAKSSFFQADGSKLVPMVREVFEHSKKYAYDIEGDLKKRFIITMGLTCNALKNSCKRQKEEVDLETIRNVAESHLFNILFVKSCEIRQILPIKSDKYLRLSLYEIIETLDFMNFDPEKGLETFFNFFQKGTAFGGNEFTYEGFQIFDRFINLYEIIHDGTAKSKDFGFEIEGFKESIFSKDEWKFATRHKITNGEMIRILFTLNFIESNVPGRNHQQIPYSYFTPRQMGSIYESFLEYRLEDAKSDMIFRKGQWVTANLNSNQVRHLKLVENYKVKKGELFFSPNNEDRKMTGSYYTPDFVVKYIVENTLAPLIQKLTSKEILELRICDPAMGSGHFLSGALDFLVVTYREKWCEENNDDLAEPIEETARKVLESCLYGVDINPRAVKLANMSLWLMTAYAGKKLERIDDQLKPGNSLADSFSWQKEFKDVFKDGGFDAVIGNPPYKRELDFKDEMEFYSKQKIGVYSAARMDLWYYFVHLGFKILKEDAPISFIVNAYWLNSSGALNLTNDIKENRTLEELVFLSKKKVFKDVSGQHLIFKIKNKKSSNDIKILRVADDNLDDTKEYFDGVKKFKKYYKSHHDLFNGDGVDIEIQNDIYEKVFNSTLKPLSDFGEFRQGIAENPSTINRKTNEKFGNKWKTGAGVFVLSKEELKALNLNEAEMKFVHKYHDLKDIEKYAINKNTDHFILYLTRHNCTDIKKYPNLYKHLSKYKDVMAQRRETLSGSNFWWQLHWPRDEKIWQTDKILSLQMGKDPSFALALGECYVPFSVNVFTTNGSLDLYYLLAILNSKIISNWFNHNAKKRGVGLEISGGVFRNVPIKIGTKAQMSKLSDMTKKLVELKEFSKPNNKKIDDLILDIERIVAEIYGYPFELLDAEVDLAA